MVHFTSFATNTELAITKPSHQKTIVLLTGAFISNNGMELSEQKAYYDKLVIPESRRLM
ncbi:hypothetical protein [Flavobacterium aquatile]|uniref:hypothetical protein n=1 Tax=Flavobacterium aquatile TaxID=245 RepID=UPI000A8FE58C|nr:hypothetical protein [Flavobacterium aquatile]GEC80158.1 hypothetical protein FAQ01_30280 [Flavobacterium aquatile]